MYDLEEVAMVGVLTRLRQHEITIGIFVTGVILLATFLYGLSVGGLEFVPIVLGVVKPAMLWQNMLVLGLVVLCKLYVDSSKGWLKFRLGLGLPLVEHFVIPVYGLLLWLLVVAIMPAIVYAEEWLFRDGGWLFGDSATSWPQLLQLAWLFGALHMANKIPLGYSLILVGVGLWLGYQYINYGLETAAANHLVYNYLNMAAALPTVLKSTFVIFRKDST
jgi:hypothetical protein